MLQSVHFTDNVHGGGEALDGVYREVQIITKDGQLVICAGGEHDCIQGELARYNPELQAWERGVNMAYRHVSIHV